MQDFLQGISKKNKNIEVINDSKTKNTVFSITRKNNTVLFI